MRTVTPLNPIIAVGDGMRSQVEASEDSRLAADDALRNLLSQGHVSGVVIAVVGFGHPQSDGTVVQGFEANLSMNVRTEAQKMVATKLMPMFIARAGLTWRERMKLAWQIWRNR